MPYDIMPCSDEHMHEYTSILHKLTIHCVTFSPLYTCSKVGNGASMDVQNDKVKSISNHIHNNYNQKSRAINYIKAKEMHSAVT